MRFKHKGLLELYSNVFFVSGKRGGGDADVNFMKVPYFSKAICGFKVGVSRAGDMWRKKKFERFFLRKWFLQKV